jgi:hypothetical protein
MTGPSDSDRSADLAVAGRLLQAMRRLPRYSPKICVRSAIRSRQMLSSTHHGVTINRRDDTLAAFDRGFIRYSSFDRRIEYAGKPGEFVVIMGNEVLAPKGKAPNAGRIVQRRFTDIWRNEQGVRRLALRQATVVNVE